MVSLTLSTLVLGLLSLPLATSHLVLTYPGWRGDSLNSSGTVNQTNGMNGVTDISGNSSELLYPFGQQWAYPCGGTPLTTNRTYWPSTGGAVAFEPGWFQGHQFGLIYINLCDETNPRNCSLVMVPPFQIVGPYNTEYPHQGVCLPQVPLPANYNATVGGNATIQVILAAQHGAALYSCVDITFAEPGSDKIQQVTPDNCRNSTEIGFNMVVTTRSLTASAGSIFKPSTLLASIPVAAVVMAGMVW